MLGPPFCYRAAIKRVLAVLIACELPYRSVEKKVACRYIGSARRLVNRLASISSIHTLSVIVIASNKIYKSVI